jgi:hypothetical protein
MEDNPPIRLDLVVLQGDSVMHVPLFGLSSHFGRLPVDGKLLS